MRYYIELEFKVRTGSADDLDQHTDDLQDALMDEPGAVDADICAELASGVVTISMYVNGDDDQDAFAQALVVARSAIHKAGGFTGGWLDDIAADEGLLVEETYNVRVQEMADACQ